MADKPAEKKLKEDYMQYQILTQHVKQLQQQIENVQEQLADVTNVSENVAQIKELKKDSEMLVPVANGIFIKTRLKGDEDMLVNVGTNVVVKKTFPQVQEMLSLQRDELEGLYDQLAIQFQRLHMRSAELEEKLKRLVEENV